MSERFINLNCANCGAKLEIYEDFERFACGYCGTQLVVQRRGGTVILKGVTDAIRQIQTGTDKTAAELALVRLEKEMRSLNAELEAIRTRANAIGDEPTVGSWPWMSIMTIGASASGVVAALDGIRAATVSALGLVVVLLIIFFAERDRASRRHDGWSKAKLTSDAEIESLKGRISQRSREIGRQMEIVSDIREHDGSVAGAIRSPYAVPPE